MTRAAHALLGLPVEGAIGKIAIGHLEAAADGLSRLSKPSDSEALHDFRVAVRRLRSLLRAYRPFVGRAAGRKIRRRLRELARATNAGRDAEVQIKWLEARRDALRRHERAGLNWLLRELRRTKRETYTITKREGRRTFAKLDGALRRRLADVVPDEPMSFRRAFGTLLQEHAEDLAEHLAGIRHAEDQEHKHQTRLSAKRLRYLLEPVAPALDRGKAAIKRLKALQDLLGELNDVHVLAATVAAGLERVSAEKAKRLHALALEGRETELARERRRDERLGLVRIAQLAQDRRDELFAALQADWLGGRTRSFLGELRILGVGMAAPEEHTEVERKYLLTAVPERALAVEPRLVKQGWLPGDTIRERIRQVTSLDGDRYVRTLKLGSGLQRFEIEEEMTQELFASLWPLTEGCRVEKRRYRVEENGLVWEIDDFLDRDLALAELELPAPDTPVTIPAWLAPHLLREVTGEPSYVNLNLAR